VRLVLALSRSAEMDGMLDGSLPNLLQFHDVSTRRIQGIWFENVSLTVGKSFTGKTIIFTIRHTIICIDKQY
jgi:hypothetical protein